MSVNGKAPPPDLIPGAQLDCALPRQVGQDRLAAPPALPLIAKESRQKLAS